MNIGRPIDDISWNGLIDWVMAEAGEAAVEYANGDGHLGRKRRPSGPITEMHGPGSRPGTVAM